VDIEIPWEEEMLKERIKAIEQVRKRVCDYVVECLVSDA
jgi:hypothetical protein